MNRGEIITRFRQENPEITSNVASDSVLQSWCEVGNLEVCTRVRLVKGSTTITSISSQNTYDLSSEITNFYDIDEYPGGGVAYSNKRLTLTTKAELDQTTPLWRSSSSGTPTKYYRRGKNLILYRTPDTSGDDIDVDSVLIPDALDDDNKTPFNELSYLEPFHYSLVLYLKMRTFNGKVKREGMAQDTMAEYNEYIKWMDNEIDRGIYTKIQIRPPSYYRGTAYRRNR